MKKEEPKGPFTISKQRHTHLSCLISKSPAITAAEDAAVADIVAVAVPLTTVPTAVTGEVAAAVAVEAAEGEVSTTTSTMQTPIAVLPLAATSTNAATTTGRWRL